MKKIISYLLALIGITIISCKNDDPIAEYGCPYAEFNLKGKVTDVNNNPINQIRIVLKGQDELTDTLFTDENGGFNKTITINPWNKEYEIQAEDIDSSANGGEYSPQNKELILNDQDFVDASGDWYAGKVSKTIDFKLNVK